MSAYRFDVIANINPLELKYGKKADLDLRRPWTPLREQSRRARMQASGSEKKRRRLARRETALIRRVWAKHQMADRMMMGR